MNDQQPTTARTAADLPKGTRVMSSEGRMGTVNGVDVGRVTVPGHVNYGREYVGVNWDAVEGDKGLNRRSRPFVDELTIASVETPDMAERVPGTLVDPWTWLRRPMRKYPDIRQLANPKKADPETVAEIHASRCPECKGAGCPSCGYKGVARIVCPVHRVVDKRGGRAIELGAVPACESGITYGAWSEGAGGFVYSGDCATEVANWAADELREYAKEDDTDKFQILAMCPDHDEQPKDGCEECATEE